MREAIQREAAAIIGRIMAQTADGHDLARLTELDREEPGVHGHAYLEIARRADERDAAAKPTPIDEAKEKKLAEQVAAGVSAFGELLSLHNRRQEAELEEFERRLTKIENMLQELLERGKRPIEVTKRGKVGEHEVNVTELHRKVGPGEWERMQRKGSD
jgi:hypothetical protein